MDMSVSDEQPGEAAPEGPVTIGRFRYVRAPRPLHFPTSLKVPESRLHEALCALLRAFLRHAFTPEHSVGGDQFIYWDPTDPRACLAPDAFVRLGTPDSKFKSWKVWEWGAPELALEIVSETDDNWDTKLQKYARLGVRELVSFDAERTPAVLRIWDRLDSDMVERELSTGSAASNVLPGFWVVVNDAEHGPALRLSHDETGTQLFLTPTEAKAEAQRQAEARIRELEAELARRQG